MSSANTIQEKTEDDVPTPGLHFKIEAHELSRLLHQVLAAKNLAFYAQGVAKENKTLKERTDELERRVAELTKLPTLLKVNEKKSNLASHSQNFHFPDTSVTPSEGYAKQATSLRKTYTTENRDNGNSLRVDGDTSVSIAPTHLGNINVVHSRMSPVSGTSECESVDTNDPPRFEDADALSCGVSREYFDMVVKELAKSKLLIRQLLSEKGGKTRDVMNEIQMRQDIKYLESENQQLKAANVYFRNLLVSEATSDEQPGTVNNEILKYHDKVQKLEGQLTLKNKALDELKKQADMWTMHGQKIAASGDKVENQGLNTSKLDTVASPETSEQGSGHRKNEEVLHMRDTVSALKTELEESKRKEKISVEEIKYLRYQVQKSQSEMGDLNKQKTQLESELKSKKDQAFQRQFEFRKLQEQLHVVQEENEKLRLKLANVAWIQPVLKPSPVSIPSKQAYKPTTPAWQQDVKQMLLPDCDEGLSDTRFEYPSIHKQKEGFKDFLCKHCLRDDFRDENSFHQHIQKCGD